jgi:phosphatidylserine/phosphatidylglycerophosphate/cardiolipin synthase-like enzyme
MRTFFWLALALALVAPACAAPLEEPPAADGAPPGPADASEPGDPPEVTLVGRWQSYFNEPGPANGYTDSTLRDRLVAYISGAVPGSEIRAHVTTLSGAASMRVVVDALIAAHDRGVVISMVHNGDSFFFPELERRLGGRYVHCGTPEVENNTACLSSVDDGTHHMKNWYFSHVDLGSNVYEHLVVATSYNITVTQSQQFNDMLAVSGNQELYDAHVAVFDDYLHQRKTDDRHGEPGGRIFVPSAATYTAEFSPQKAGDMIADALERISQYEEGCALRVATLNLTRSAIIGQLVRIAELGCEVRVVTGTKLSADNQSRLNAAGIQTRNVDIVHGGGHTSLHNKMMVYNGFYDTPVGAHRKDDRVWVWTGSQNFTARPLRFRDDVFVGISRLGVYNNYAAHFETIWAAGQ